MQGLGVSIKEVRDGILCTGELDALHKAESLILAELDEIKGNCETITVPRRKHGAIIGPRGVQIEILRQDTGCRIVVPPVEAKSDNIELCGTPEAIAKAKADIGKILEESS